MKIKILASVLLLFGLFAYAHWIEPQWIEVTHHLVSVAGSGEKGLNKPILIGQLSDLHIREMGTREAKILAALEVERPDAIVVTGDSIAENSNYEALSAFLRQLRAPLGVWLVNGNWEHWRPTRDEILFYEAAGVRFLSNGSAQLQNQVWLVGVDDETAGLPDLAKSLREIPNGSFKIGLFHSPSFFKRSAENFNLVLTGHTHGGQIRLPFFQPFWLPQGSGGFVEGWYSRANSKMYVSRGLGNSILDLRFFCRPELAIFKLAPE